MRAVSLVLLTLWVTSSSSPNFVLGYVTNRNPEQYCVSKGCMITAGAMLKNLDESVAPCDNFYAYACGNYYASVLPDPEEISVNLERQRYYGYLAELKIILDAPKDLSEDENARKLKDLYFACMNSTSSDQLQSLQLFLGDFGGWPLVEGVFWDKRYFNWLGMNMQMIKHGLWSATVITLDEENLENSVPSPITILPNDMHLIKSILQSVLNKHEYDLKYLFQKILEELGSKGNKTDELREMVDTGKGLLQILSENSIDEKLYTNISYLEDLSPPDAKLQWRLFLEQVYQRKVTDEEEIVIRSPKVFENVVKFLDTSEKRSVANLMFLCLLLNIYKENYFTPDVTQHVRDYLLYVPEESRKNEPSAEYCIRISYQALPQVLQELHSKKYFTPEVVDLLASMEKVIRSAFEKQMVDGDFLDENMKEKISTTMQAERAMDGFATLREDFYNNLEKTNDCLIPNRRDHFSNMVAIGELNYNRLMQKIKHPAPTSILELLLRWNLETDVRFYDFAETNRTLMYVPPQFLRGLYYTYDRPDYLNYGALGFYMARALYSSLQFIPDTTALFKSDDCLTRQMATLHREYETKSHAVKDENVRDVTLDMLGLQLAYQVLRNVSEGEEAGLPGMNLTSSQLFWLSYTTSLCQVYDLEETSTPPTETLGETRILNSLRNNPHFAVDFQCPPNSFMNPDHQCKTP